MKADTYFEYEQDITEGRGHSDEAFVSHASTDQIAVHIEVPADNTTSTPVDSSPARLTFFRAFAIVRYLLALSTTAGALIMIGHIMLRYTMLSSIGNAYRQVPIISSLIMCLVGGPMFGFMIIGGLVAVLFVAFTCTVVHRKLSGGTVQPDSRGPAPPQGRRVNHSPLFDLVLAIPLVPGVNVCGTLLIRGTKLHLTVLDGEHAFVAGLLAALLILCTTMILLCLRPLKRRHQGNIALPQIEGADAAMDTWNTSQTAGEASLGP